jgi:hypothetical protein
VSRQAETGAAVTRQTAPVAAAAEASATQETPFYKKMFGGVADLFSTSSAQPPVAEAVQTEPAAPARMAPAMMPVPQKRAQTPTIVKVANAN